MGNLMRFILNVWPRVNQEYALFFIHQGRVIPPALAGSNRSMPSGLSEVMLKLSAQRATPIRRRS
jgi:hypothetical protein